MGGDLLKTIFLLVLLVVLLYGSILYMANAEGGNPFMISEIGVGGIRVSSSAFAPNGKIPPKYTCQGPNVNPELQISGVTAEAKSLAVILYEADRRNGDAYHWIVVNVNPSIMVIRENSIPEGGVHLVNDYGSATYIGPCPQEGVHEYVYKIYALDSVLEKNQFKSVTELMEYLNANNLGTASYRGKYSKL